MDDLNVWGGSRHGSGRPSKWRSGKCKAIKIPEAIADQVLEIARQIDIGADSDRTVVEKLHKLMEKVKAKEQGYRTNAAGKLFQELRNLLEDTETICKSSERTNSPELLSSKELGSSELTPN